MSADQTRRRPSDLPPWFPAWASQLADLRTLVQDAGAWGLSPDVANLAGKVVFASPANKHYFGAPLLPTGQLSAGGRGN